MTYSTKLGVHCFIHLFQIQKKTSVSAKVGLHALMVKYNRSPTAFWSGDSPVVVENEFGLETI